MTPAERTSKWQKENRERVNAKNRAWRAANPEKARQYEAAKRAKDPERYKAYQRQQKRKKAGIINPTDELRVGKCDNPGCNYDGPLVLDHCHTTGTARGWLCNPCNTSFGALQESEARILGLNEYRKRHLTAQPGDARLIE